MLVPLIHYDTDIDDADYVLPHYLKHMAGAARPILVSPGIEGGKKAVFTYHWPKASVEVHFVAAEVSDPTNRCVFIQSTDVTSQNHLFNAVSRVPRSSQRSMWLLRMLKNPQSKRIKSGLRSKKPSDPNISSSCMLRTVIASLQLQHTHSDQSCLCFEVGAVAIL